jgi:acyl-coenzyme A thioesterase PaaI-like protein
MTTSLQDTYAPRSICFGCGPANPRGLHIKSFVRGADVVAEWKPEEFHHAFENVLNGGIIATILDCHSNWTAAEYLRRVGGVTEPPPTVTADFSVRFRRPTPMGIVVLRGRVVKQTGDRPTVETELTSGGEVTATFRGTFAAVKQGHPAYARWR